LGNTSVSVTSDVPSEGGMWKTVLAAGATVVIPLDSIATAVFLMLRATASDQTLTMAPLRVTLNGTDSVVLAPIGTGREAHFVDR